MFDDGAPLLEVFLFDFDGVLDVDDLPMEFVGSTASTATGSRIRTTRTAWLSGLSSDDASELRRAEAENRR